MSHSLTVAQSACVTIVVASAIACTSYTSTVSGFPGLAITATCRPGSSAAHYSLVDGMYPGERATGEVLDSAFLGRNGELPLPCIDRHAESYRVYWTGGGEFGGFTMVTISHSADHSRIGVMWKGYGGELMPVRSAERALLEQEWRSVAAELSTTTFWVQPARPMPEPFRPCCEDWIRIEGYADSRYHSVSRHYYDSLLTGVLNAIRELAIPMIEESAKKSAPVLLP